MKLNKMFIVSILLLAILALGAVSASEDVSDDLFEAEPIDDVIIEESIDDSSLESNDEEVLAEGETLSLTDLKSKLTSGEEQITLENDYAYSEGDESFTTIDISDYGKNFTLDGKGHAIDGKAYGSGMENANLSINVYGNATFKNIIFKNFFKDADAAENNFIHWWGSNGKFENCTFLNISSTSGALVYASNQTISFEGCTFKSNDVHYMIYRADWNTKINNSVFIGNRISYILSASGNTQIENCNFTGNSILEDGCLIYFSGSGDKIVNCNFNGNSIGDYGYLLFFYGANAQVINCNFSDTPLCCLAQLIHIWGNGCQIIDSNFYNNTMIESFIIYLYADNVKIMNCNFTDNDLDGDDVINVEHSRDLLVSDSTFKNNVADAIYMKGYSGNITRCNFLNNVGYAIYWNGDDGNISECTFSNNGDNIRGNGNVNIDNEIYNLVLRVNNNTMLGYPNAPFGSDNSLVYYLNKGAFSGNISISVNGVESYNKEMGSQATYLYLDSFKNIKYGLNDILVKFINETDELVLHNDKVFVDYYIPLYNLNSPSPYPLISMISLPPHFSGTLKASLPAGATGTLTLNDGIHGPSVLKGDTFTLDTSKYSLGYHTFSLSLKGDPVYQDKTFEYDIYIYSLIEAPSAVSIGENGVIKYDLPDDFNGFITIYKENGDGERGDVIKNVTVKGEGTIPLDFLQLGQNPLILTCTGDYNTTRYVNVCLIENNPGISSSLDSNTIGLGSDAILRLTVPNSTSYIDLFLDGSWYDEEISGNTTYAFKFSRLSLGEHSIKVVVYDWDDVNHKSVYLYSKTLTVNVKEKVQPAPVTVPAKIVAKDYNAYYNKGTYTVTVYGTDGKVAKGVSVVFKINGKKVATVKTNSKGIAKFKIPAKYVPKKYKISATALGKTVTKKLTIKQVLKLKKVAVKKSAKKLVLKATLKEGKKALKGKKIVFRFKGKKYTAKTNKKGIAKVTIKKAVLKKLKKGKKVTYKATYLKDTVKRTVKVKK